MTTVISDSGRETGDTKRRTARDERARRPVTGRGTPVTTMLIAVAFACGVWTSAATALQAQQVGAQLQSIWAADVAPHLADSLWTPVGRTAFDVQLLMVPLHGAFALGDSTWQAQFADQFKRLMVSSPPDTFSIDDELSWLQFDYLASQFVALSIASGKGSLIPPGLVDYLGRVVDLLWVERPAEEWRRAPFHGIKERLDWKLHTQATTPSYFRAIVDQERYLFSIAADLARYERLSGTHHSWSGAIGQILDAARAVYEQRVVWKADGGWLFQPGVWADHPEYQHVGQNRKVAGMPPAPIRDIAEDASHSFRMPLWLVSLRDAARNPGEAAFYDRLLVGLEKQFVNHVLVPPTDSFPSYRTTNFMDGRNGVYRLGYSGRGATWGYGPYELSPSFLEGWWVFLGTERIRAAYADQAQRFPPAPIVLHTYLRHEGPLNADTQLHAPSFLQAGGIFQLIDMIAARLPARELGP